MKGEKNGKPYKKPRKQDSRNKPEILEAENPNVKICKISPASFATVPDILDSHAALQIPNFNSLRHQNEYTY